uniref:Uncharacterized protein LOC111108893 n=1 Tax=Crassostrea virginica TaxID=6565 RepID=A0A8B8BB85_CRAVI|nr:uncharacterized protein LOC111108893 [Crassostrea virginica]
MNIMRDCHEIVYSFFLIGSVFATDRSSSFHRRENVNLTQLQPFVLSTTTTVTEIVCLAQCLDSVLCVTAGYNGNDKSCRLYSVSPSPNDSGDTVTTHIKFYRRKATCQEFGYKTIVNTSECYKIHPTALTKTGASKECQQEGGHLIRITSSHMLANLIVDIDYLGLLQTYLYIDGYKRQNETDWRFSDETIMTFLHWNIGEPNGMHLPNPEDALVLGDDHYEWMYSVKVGVAR